jgi:regulator of CtrA degradation
MLMIGIGNPFDRLNHRGNMMTVRRAQIENLYRETLQLAEEAQQIFAEARENAIFSKDQELSLAAFAEATMTAARLTHILAWLLHQRAVMSGEPGAYLSDSATDFTNIAPADWNICHQLDEPVRRVTAASERLYERVLLFQDLWDEPIGPSPVQRMLAELEARL